MVNPCTQEDKLVPFNNDFVTNISEKIVLSRCLYFVSVFVNLEFDFMKISNGDSKLKI